jgi:ParB family chromosome partitioning protein
MEQFQILPIEKVYESPLNPRRHFNQKKMEELVESIRAKGIMAPLIVRPNNGRFEIGAGHRRYRAALEVKLKELPTIVREISDQDFLELLTIENLQHEDITPLDEARSFQTLIEKNHCTVADIAAKLGKGKSESYIYQRLKLLELIPEAQKQLTEEKITAGHAILIARLQPNEQKECLEAIKEESYYGPGMSVRDLASHIEAQIHLDLNSASFSKKDPDLVPEAGPCTTCPKRTGFVPTLFPDIKKKDTCTDPSCFHKKVAAFTTKWLKENSEDSDRPPLRLSRDYDGRIKKLPEDPEKPVPANLWTEIADRKKESCASAREGIVIEGRGQGQVMTVCADPKCQKHHGHYESSSEMNKWRVQQKVAEEKRKQEKNLRLRVIDVIINGVKELDKADLAFIAGQLYDELWNEYQKEILRRHGLKPVKLQHGFDNDVPAKKYIESCSSAHLGRLLMEMALIRNIDSYNQRHGKKNPLMAVAERHGVKVEAIEAELKQALKEKAISKAKKKTSKKTKPQPGICRVCGCTDDTPCEGPGGVLCHWADRTKTLCSVCRDKGVKEELHALEKEEKAKKPVHTRAKKKK